MVQIDDILAALFMTLAMMRRLEVLSVSKEENPHVREADLDQWRALALRGYNMAAVACAGKVVLSLTWFYFLQGVAVVLHVGGIVITIVWILLLVSAWRITTEAGALRKDLGILRRGESQAKDR